MKNLLCRIAALVLAIPATLWARHHERRILRLGVPLDATGLADARHLGVAAPDRIRLLAVDAIPNPFQGLMSLFERWTHLCITDAAGLTLRHGIFIGTALLHDRVLIAHECVHTRQYEQHGSLYRFLTAYIHQCLLHGYHNAPLEQEARDDSAAIL